ncbi:MAG TPA: class I SAM-dependent RNA methyltransferase [Persephonella sp.]|uniref:23S rRNA (Uracil-5-)-methyltransferase n=1 Tax=Persephonella marina (strain DSM 14350 / EX-H1) TaxID=123214 RepID=C0QRS2_PERMH|nr:MULTISPECIES: class I SAM-dependent RNA methyltransferase [Persephonella]ACO03273.1 23S rRNA (uracil-5-)-methyltransferase [Persephonella marina EX-H1]HCB69113.1 class I SAM-dependent RNA methyltransferase [Persephonella sp.]
MIVKIEKLVYGGKGIGKLDGRVCFVPFVLPDEEVEVEIKKEKKSFIECEPLSIVEKSPFRTDPPCRYFRYCGGCDYQHITYEKQVEIKAEILLETLNRIGRLNIDRIDKIYPSKKPFNYRNRTQLKIRGEKIGFYMRESRQIINIDSCLLLKEDINGMISGVREILKFLIFQPEQVHIYSSSDGEALVKFVYQKRVRRFPLGLKHLRSFLSEKLKGAGIYHRKDDLLKRDVLLGESYIYEEYGGIKFRVSMDSFFQVNVYQVENLLDAVLQNIGDHEKAVDLFCGVGTLTLPSARYIKEIYGIESNPYAVNDANHNRKLNRIKNAKFFRMDANRSGGFIAELKPDLVIIDPPRTGVSDDLVRTFLDTDSIKRIIYVSCNPSTLARDLGYLKERYSVEKVYMIDMFPQTYHIESVVVLQKMK